MKGSSKSRAADRTNGEGISPSRRASGSGHKQTPKRRHRERAPTRAELLAEIRQLRQECLRREARSGVHATEAELHIVTDVTTVMLTRCGRDMRYKFVNRSYASQLGLSAEEIVGQPIRSILGEAAFQVMLPYLEQVLSGQPVEYEAEIPFPKAGQRFCRVAYMPDMDAHGNVIGWVAAITDVTERKQEELRLDIRDSISRDLAEASSLREVAARILETICERARWDTGALWLVSQNGREMWCLDCWHKPGLPMAEFEAETRRHRFPIGQGVPGWVWSLGEAQFMTDLGTVKHFIRAVAARHCGLRSGFCAPIRLGGKVLGAIEGYSRQERPLDEGFLNLLTAISAKVARYIEHKQAEIALRLSEERLRHILDTALDAVITIEADNVITGWNSQASHIFGWTQEEAMGRKLDETILPPQLRAAHARSMRHYLDTGEGPMFDRLIELTALRRDGTEFPVELAIAPLVLDDRVAFAVFVRDITERKASEEALRRHVEEMAAANLDLERFNRAAVDRELRMIELKQEVNALCVQASLPPRYELNFVQSEGAAAPESRGTIRP